MEKNKSRSVITIIVTVIITVVVIAALAGLIVLLFSPNGLSGFEIFNTVCNVFLLIGSAAILIHDLVNAKRNRDQLRVWEKICRGINDGIVTTQKYIQDGVYTSQKDVSCSLAVLHSVSSALYESMCTECYLNEEELKERSRETICSCGEKSLSDDSDSLF